MAYAFQTFTSGQVLTKGQEQQTEDNVRDHIHGQLGVGPAGLNWAVSSATGAVSAVSSMSGQLWELAGDFTVSFAAAATLGTGFAQTFVNIGSGRILLSPNGSQLIDETSFFVLTPKASINVLSDGANLKLFGQTRGWFPLWSIDVAQAGGSLQFVICDKMFPGDFKMYQFRVDDVIISSAVSVFKAFVSEDSGSTFTTAGYSHGVDADTAFMRLSNASPTSNQLLQAYGFFTNRAAAGVGLFFDTYSVERGVSGALNPQALGDETIAAPVSNIINAMKFMPSSRAYMTQGKIAVLGLR